MFSACNKLVELVNKGKGEDVLFSMFGYVKQSTLSDEITQSIAWDGISDYCVNVLKRQIEDIDKDIEAAERRLKFAPTTETALVKLEEQALARLAPSQPPSVIKQTGQRLREGIRQRFLGESEDFDYLPPQFEISIERVKRQLGLRPSLSKEESLKMLKKARKDFAKRFQETTDPKEREYAIEMLKIISQLLKEERQRLDAPPIALPQEDRNLPVLITAAPAGDVAASTGTPTADAKLSGEAEREKEKVPGTLDSTFESGAGSAKAAGNIPILIESDISGGISVRLNPDFSDPTTSDATLEEFRAAVESALSFYPIGIKGFFLKTDMAQKYLGYDALSDFKCAKAHYLYERTEYSQYEYIKNYMKQAFYHERGDFDVAAFCRNCMPQSNLGIGPREIYRQLRNYDMNIFGAVDAMVMRESEAKKKDFRDPSAIIITEDTIYQNRSWRIDHESGRKLPGETFLVVNWRGRRYLLYASSSHSEEGKARQWRAAWGGFAPGLRIGNIIKAGVENADDLTPQLCQILDRFTQNLPEGLNIKDGSELLVNAERLGVRMDQIKKRRPPRDRRGIFSRAAGVNVLVLTDDVPAAQEQMRGVTSVNVTYKEIDGSLSQLSGLPAQAAGFDRVLMFFNNSGLADSVRLNLGGIEVVDISDEAQAAEFAKALATGA